MAPSVVDFICSFASGEALPAFGDSSLQLSSSASMACSSSSAEPQGVGERKCAYRPAC